MSNLIKGKQIAAGTITKNNTSSEIASTDGLRPFTGLVAYSPGLVPTSDDDLADKGYVDAVAQGLSVKESVIAATTAVLPACTYYNGPADDGVGATLTANANGAFPLIDNQSITAGLGHTSRVLVKNQADPKQNGIYNLTTQGSGGSAWVLTRSTDANNGTKLKAGTFTFVEQGDTQADSGWVMTTNDPITLGYTNIVWVQFSNAGIYTGGDGIVVSGTVIDIVIAAGSEGLTLAPGELGLDYAESGDLVSASADVADAGVSTEIPRADHRHNVTTGTPGAVAVGDAAAEGLATTLARSDHIHSVAGGMPVPVGEVCDAGVSTAFARADHVHARDSILQEEITSQVITGTDTALTDILSHLPIGSNAVLLFLNGQQMVQGAGKDYTISGQTITWLAASGTAPDMEITDTLVVYYPYVTAGSSALP